MTFTYDSFTSTQADGTMWGKINNKLNSLSKEQANSVKVAASDMKGKDARAVIVYCSSEAPNPETLGSTWRYTVFETGTDYTNMYEACIEYLNTSAELSETQKYYSRISMTNASGHDSRLVLYYRDQK